MCQDMSKYVNKQENYYYSLNMSITQEMVQAKQHKKYHTENYASLKEIGT